MMLAMGVAAGLLLTVVGIRLFENSFIYFPPRFPEGFSPPELYGLHVEDVWLTTLDKLRVNAWYLPNPASEKVLLWFHGNAENIGHGLEHLSPWGSDSSQRPPNLSSSFQWRTPGTII